MSKVIYFCDTCAKRYGYKGYWYIDDKKINCSICHKLTTCKGNYSDSLLPISGLIKEA